MATQVWTAQLQTQAQMVWTCPLLSPPWQEVQTTHWAGGPKMRVQKRHTDRLVADAHQRCWLTTHREHHHPVPPCWMQFMYLRWYQWATSSLNSQLPRFHPTNNFCIPDNRFGIIHHQTITNHGPLCMCRITSWSQDKWCLKLSHSDHRSGGVAKLMMRIRLSRCTVWGRRANKDRRLLSSKEAAREYQHYIATMLQ